jgi:3-isopropylmalate/(R)-2-methylmalate dehydratase small subunit
MSLKNLQGRVAWVFEEDDYDIDLIVGVSNIKITDLNELAALVMADRAPGFAGLDRRRGRRPR